MRAVVFTLGCKVNECESQSLARGLKNLGYEVSDELVPADLYIVNTCAVTKEAEKKSRQTASRIKKLNPNAKVMFTGCATQNSPEDFKDKFKDCVVTGTFKKSKILELLSSTGINVFSEDKEFDELLPVKTLKTRNFIKVQDGCNNSCSYCLIPYLRGRTRSRSPKNVLDEIALVSPKEAVITGINLSAYNYNGTTLTGLIRELKHVDCRIRLGSLEVSVIDKEFLQALKELNNFAPHFHLSLQSGCDRVLKNMNRHYTCEEYLKKVELIREFFPTAGITTDIIVGFPYETDEDFNETLSFVDKVKFSDIHPFAFSAREGTRAFSMPEVDGEIKKQRLSKLIEKKKTCKDNFVNSLIGKTVECLIEESDGEYVKGYSENYVKLYVKGYKGNQDLIKVKIVRPYLDGAIATLEDK